MSHSYRHRAAWSITVAGAHYGEQPEKRDANRSLRRWVRAHLQTDPTGEHQFPQVREWRDPWWWLKDGKSDCTGLIAKGQIDLGMVRRMMRK